MRLAILGTLRHVVDLLLAFLPGYGRVVQGCELPDLMHGAQRDQGVLCKVGRRRKHVGKWRSCLEVLGICIDGKAEEGALQP